MLLLAHHFGSCPECDGLDGFINIGRGHWFYCSEHKKTWYGGSNIFSSWREQTIVQQKAIYDALGFEQFTQIKNERAA